MLRRALSVLALTTLMLTGTARPASAHNELRSTDPAGGATVASAPSEIRLTFAQTSNLDFARIAVTDAAGVDLADWKPTAAGTTLVQRVKPVTAAGTVVVGFRVVSNDGHPVQGSVTFTAAASAVPAGTPPAATGAPDSASGSAPPTGSRPAARRSWPTVAIVLGAAAVVAVAVAGAAYRLTRRRP
jgi:copper resistance protein C